MKTLFIQLIATLVVISGFSQNRKFEIQEMKGEVLGITSGFSFAYSGLTLKKAGNDTAYFRFSPQYGALMVQHYKAGSEIELRANVALDVSPRQRKMIAMYNFQDALLAVKIDGKWVPLEEARWEGKPESKVFLERKVKENYYGYGEMNALLLAGNTVAFINPDLSRIYQLKKINVGEVVSFIGYAYPAKEGYAYPRWQPQHVYSFVPLTKAQGTVKSFLYKQNYVYIGLVIQTRDGEVQLSFPSDMARQVKQFVDEHPSMTAYSSGFKLEDQLNPPELHALASDGDTLKIDRFGFYGGADVKHEHKPTELEGKITALNRSGKGNVISFIVGTDCYIEVDHNMEKQLSSYLKKGNVIKVSGQERIKHEGEIYAKDYRIVTPREITVDGKVFLLNILAQ